MASYAKENGYSQTIGLFTDFSPASGEKRFFIVELSTKKILDSGLVAHGHCQEDEEAVRFSNVPNSNCSSEGKYRVGKSYFGTFGLAFKLHGLDETNSKAFERFVVMHAHPCVYDEETEHEICESERGISARVHTQANVWARNKREGRRGEEQMGGGRQRV